MLATLTQAGRAAMLLAIKEKDLHFAWGTGNEAWDEDETLKPSLFEAVQLTAEVGRRLVQVKEFVELSEEGDIILPDSYDSEGSPIFNKYKISSEPTTSLYMKVTFDYGDAWQHTIREIGVFSDTLVNEELPIGQLYFEPHQVVNRGNIIAIRHEQPSQRDPARRDTYEFILSL